MRLHIESYAGHKPSHRGSLQAIWANCLLLLHRFGIFAQAGARLHCEAAEARCNIVFSRKGGQPQSFSINLTSYGACIHSGGISRGLQSSHGK